MKPSPLVTLSVAAFLLGAVVSCEVGPDYQRPKLDVPATFRSASTQESVTPHLATRWWLMYKDPVLTDIEEATIQHNPDLEAAMYRLAEARASSHDVASAFFPTITLDPSVIRSRTSANVARGGNGGGKSTTSTDYSVPFDLTYEIDIWGRVRRSYESARATYRASADDLQVVLQGLESDVAQDYWNLRSLEYQEDVYRQNIALYDNQLRLYHTELKAGIVGNIDVVQIETLRDQVVTLQIDTERQREDTEHAIAVLTGKPPSEFHIVPNALLPAPPGIPAGLPADLLRQRPDVVEAEQKLIADSANIGVAVANFYPVVSLTGAAGFESLSAQSLFDWQSRALAFGPNISFPVFNGGKLNADLDLAQQNYNELAATYRSTVLGALHDVEDALTDLHARYASVEAQQRAVDSSREYLRLAQLEYNQGVFSNLQVIDADRTLLTNEITLAQLLGNRLISSVVLIKAIGGGWDGNPPATTQPTTQVSVQEVPNVTQP